MDSMRPIITLTCLLLTACSTADKSKQNDTDNHNDVKNNGIGGGSSNTLDTDSGISANVPASHTDGIKNLDESDTDCGGSAPRCSLNKTCINHSDCISNACRYDHVCTDAPSCINHFGGDTCGQKENEEANASHESCCKSLPVPGFTDANHPGKIVYLDKYEITAGRVRTFIDAITTEMGGKPDVKGWIVKHRPAVWNAEWEAFLPSDYEGRTITINRLLLGDPRHDGETNPGPGIIVPPTTDQVVNLGLNQQFNGQVFADVHGNNCGTYADSYGSPTYYYSSDILVKYGEVPRVNPLGYNGQTLVAKEILDEKSMNCITDVMLSVFCLWDGGELATTEVVDFVTSTVNATDPISSCGSQYDNHSDLLGNYFGRTIQTGGTCPNVIDINATFDAGDVLPVGSTTLNIHNYHYPDFGNSTSDKSWQIAAPGRVVKDAIRINPNDEPWMDLAGNLNESVYNPQTGLFGLRLRGVGYGSSRSDLNVTLMPGETILRVQRPEVKSALWGGRCVRFR